jgi:hypothetical protein
LVASKSTDVPALGITLYAAPADGELHTYYVRAAALNPSEESIFQLQTVATG